MSNQKLLWGVSLLVLAFSFDANAQICKVPPTCETLGFNKSAADCGKLPTLKCPFDEAKLFCTAFTNADGSSVIEIGSIVYTDIVTNVLIPGKTPLGIVIDPSGYMLALAESGEMDSYAALKEAPAYCANYKPSGLSSGWIVPEVGQLQSIGTNMAKINSGLAKLSGVAQLAPAYFSSKKTSYDQYSVTIPAGNVSSTDAKTRCVNKFCSTGICETPVEPEAYKVGDTFIKNGVAVGEIRSLDSTSQHGIVAVAAGAADIPAATSFCNTKTTGGLVWTLGTQQIACPMIGNGLNCITTAHGRGYCPGGWNPSSTCAGTSPLPYVCQAPF